LITKGNDIRFDLVGPSDLPKDEFTVHNMNKIGPSYIFYGDGGYEGKF
jgi:hypothetical protein